MRKLCLMLACVMMTACSRPAATQKPDLQITDSSEPVDYSDSVNWLKYGEGAEDAPADAFMIPATVYEEPAGNIELTQETRRKEQAIDNRMQGMVTDSCRLYSPAYRQMTLKAYADADYDNYEAYAYQDVKDAFAYYLEQIHEPGRPIVLFGYSQGAQFNLRLLIDFFAGDSEQETANRQDLAAAYLIGWGLEQSVLDSYPNLKAAQAADDTGVIISFDAEAPEVEDSLILNKDKEYVSINPLNWKTDSTRADKSENLGAVTVNAKGEIKGEQAEFCGAYLDDTSRHALKIDDISKEDYPNEVFLLPEGSYHSYNIAFFYRNLQENVTTRVNAWLQQHSS